MLLIIVKRIKQIVLLLVFISVVYGLVPLIALWTGFLTLLQFVKKGRKIFDNKQRQRPASLDDPSLGEHGNVQLQDVKIHYVANGNKDKPLMLCLHGFPEFWYSWRHQLKEFASDYRVVAIDMRGYGESDKPSKISSYRTKNVVDDIKQLLAALGYQSCILMGHDWGGAIAWGVVAAYPELVDKLIILDAPHPDAFTDYTMKNKGQLLKSCRYISFFQVPHVPEMFLAMDDMARFKELFMNKESGIRSNSMTPEDLEAYMYTFSSPGSFTGPINYYRAMFLPTIGRQFGLEKLTAKKPVSSNIDKEPMPILVIWGVHDNALETGLAEATKNHVANATVQYVEDAAHYVQNDQPDKVNEYIRRFLDDNTPEADLNHDARPTNEMATRTKVKAKSKAGIKDEANNSINGATHKTR